MRATWLSIPVTCFIHSSPAGGLHRRWGRAQRAAVARQKTEAMRPNRNYQSASSQQTNSAAMLSALAGLRLRHCEAAAVARHAVAVARALATGAGTSAPTEDAPTSPTKRNNRMRFFVINNQPQEALDLLDRSVFGKALPGPSGSGPRYAKRPPPGVCNKVLDSAAQSQDAAMLLQAADLAEALSLQGVVLEHRTLQALAYGLGRTGHVDRALPVADKWLGLQVEVLEDDEAAHHAPLQLLTHLMDCAARADEPETVLQVLARLARVGLAPTVPSMTSLLQCFMRLGQVDAAHSMVEWMRRSALPPSAYTYTALLTLPPGAGAAHARAVLLKAQEALQTMRAEGVQPTAHLYAALIHVCGRAHNMRAARAAWEDMEAAGVEPDLVLYSAMIDACAKSKEPAAAMELFEQMQRRGVRPDVVAFSSVLAAVKASPAAASQAARLWGSMQDAGVRPNGFAFSAYLDVHLTHGDIEAALQLLGDAARALDNRDSAAADIPIAALYAHALASAVHQHNLGAVERLARHMRAAGVPHTPATLGALLNAQAVQRSCSAAKWLLQAPREPAESSGAAAAWGVSDAVFETCLLGKGNAVTAMATAAEDTSAGGVGEALAVLGGLAVQSKPAEALQWFRRATESGLDLGWAGLRLAMFAALNACPPQPELVLQALAESRRYTSNHGGRDRWDLRTERAILVALRKAPATAGLLDASGAGAGALDDRLKALIAR